jgi:hypothetical protein
MFIIMMIIISATVTLRSLGILINAAQLTVTNSRIFLFPSIAPRAMGAARALGYRISSLKA